MTDESDCIKRSRSGGQTVDLNQMSIQATVEEDDELMKRNKEKKKKKIGGWKVEPRAGNQHN